ncbi:hypothetical protein [Cyclobacterium plantarum]|uniref:Transglutaminase-like domain-containing protein n=1 Tax=Cyclobacterium plantarum TaxID=2716263 RepID=A0ABX0HF22_9BACT|nr:hypothetical protein [Cyclobacterium plantarum]NHE58976.1 hypothetical protein [Cyclobacterium plantarum]
MKTLNLFLLLMLWSWVLFAQRNYQKNDHVSLSSEKTGDYYRVNYRFKDQWGNMQHFKLHFDATATEQMNARFGIPRWMFDRWTVTPENVAERQRVMQQGMFRRFDNYLKADYDAIVGYYAPVFGKPIAELIRAQLRAMDKDNRLNRIEMAMKFVQDIPYGVPKDRKAGLHRGGIHTPPEVLISGYGDCDSKTLLFAAILSYLIDPEDILFFLQDNHVLAFVAVDGHNPGGTFLIENGRRYYMAETVGPGRRRLGESARGDQRTGAIIPFKFQPHAVAQVSALPGNEASYEPGKYEIVFENRSRKKVLVMLYVQNEQGAWEIKAWYPLKHKERVKLADTPNDHFFYYAVDEKRRWLWNGTDKLLEYKGTVFGLKRKQIDATKGFGTHTITLT